MHAAHSANAGAGTAEQRFIDAQEHYPQYAGPLSLDELIIEVERRRDEFDGLSHVPPDMVGKMKRAGIFRASTPKRFGGDALPPPRFLETLERIAIADGSTAWVAAFGSANTYLASLPIETQARIYTSGPDQVFAGGLYPLQKAERAPGGFLVSGQWHFASGCKGADWIGVGIGGTPANAGDTNAGKPFTAVFPASEVEIVDNWNVVGMQGTGSHDLRLQNKFVDEAWTFVRGGAALIDEPLYRYPAVAYQAQVHASVNLGLARAALDLLASMSGVTKTTTGAPRLADRAYYRSGLAQAEASLRSARAFFFEAAETSWRTILAGNPVLPAEANLLRLSATHAAHAGAEVVMQAYKMAGINAIYRESRMQRLVRDSIVVTQHAFLGEGTYDASGAIFVGIPPVTPFP
ncbi:acyl-CoA dehydrogenase family protein [Paraburkholderia domus]|jgi:Acyl-CoA dehydrogenases|uniref:p-hydroxyphenylacetate 3-hydroxylase, oxygenase component n=1 Tax=Paraburkholderia domus TaxID=2793075 RepID=A0A9N8QWY3_9BURK|nr:acyl-CoA dehydrogenase family protein [Paraburkholderia domus]MBK5061635.1 flavin-dependent monooxygenase [Burkholderia sp. R-70199]MBK5123810.1 flavin-dependent monooxygenase [Burkholderia sp. R-69980]MBK5165445.1 flavin-dependent monooxygenase [Burkholderia sp. R-70211]CAE6783515.1 p-hydroxyphenylacetate 3-hydroxylase, oxygenase component [Paraburkholderia domus]CAE6889695.1 p-hydroxyphenylacetate 3-hydroxylase, oxygenase component [Paraburkholderia domus]